MGHEKLLQLFATISAHEQKIKILGLLHISEQEPHSGLAILMRLRQHGDPIHGAEVPSQGQPRPSQRTSPV